MTIEAALSQSSRRTRPYRRIAAGRSGIPATSSRSGASSARTSANAPPANIQDVSATGIGLRVQQASSQGPFWSSRYKRGTTVFRPLPVRVMHATALADGEWLAGCRFIRPLNGQDLRELVGDE